jgi:hypothetical protein
LHHLHNLGQILCLRVAHFGFELLMGREDRQGQLALLLLLGLMHRDLIGTLFEDYWFGASVLMVLGFE